MVREIAAASAVVERGTTNNPCPYMKTQTDLAFFCLSFKSTSE
jgi:hypothetical protein